MPSVYLAGPITGLTYDDATDWRVIAADRLKAAGITPLSPLRGKEYLRSQGKLLDQYEGIHPLSNGRGIVTRDRFDCTRADVVLANLLDAERVSIGTCMEVAWADAARRPLILAINKGDLHDHAMLKECAGYVVDSLTMALDITIAILGGS